MKKSGKKASSDAPKRCRRYSILGNLLIIVLLAVAIAAGTFCAMSYGTRHNARRTVPDFIGTQFNDAKRSADSNDLEIIINDSLYVSTYPGGVVLDQLPKGGAVVKPGRKVYVTVNTARQRIVDVPYVAGRSLRQAKNMLETVGLTIERIVFVQDLATNYVIEEYIGETKVEENGGMRVEKGSGVILHVGVAEDAPPVTVPLIVGCSLVEAKSRLWETGLNVGDVIFESDIPTRERKNAKVVWQSEIPGRPIGYGRVVALRLTLDADKVEKALAEQDLKALEFSLDADSLTWAKQQRLLDSLENLSVAQPKEVQPAPVQTDSLP